MFEFYHFLIPALFAFLGTLWIHPKVLKIALLKNLVDNPDARKLQRKPVPVMGGIAVFFGITLGLCCSQAIFNSASTFMLISAMLVMLYTGTIDDIIDLLDMKALRERGLRVLFDTMHGSGAYPLQVIFHTARCTIDTIHLNKDAYFGGMMPAPTEETLHILSHKVINEKYDLGIALDGDGDRLGIIDSNGVYVDANDILCMLYYYLHEYKDWKGPVVRNLATTHMLDKIAEGKVNKFLKENTLLSQALVKNPKQSVEQFIQEADKEATVVAYKRFSLND